MHGLSARQKPPLSRKPACSGPGRCSALVGTPLWLPSGDSPKTERRKCRNKLCLLQGSTERSSLLNSGLKMQLLFSQHSQGSPAEIPSSSQSLTSRLAAALTASMAPGPEHSSQGQRGLVATCRNSLWAQTSCFLPDSLIHGTVSLFPSKDRHPVVKTCRMHPIC